MSTEGHETSGLAAVEPVSCQKDCQECGGNGHIGGDLKSPWACTMMVKRHVTTLNVAAAEGLAAKLGQKLKERDIEGFRLLAFQHRHAIIAALNTRAQPTADPTADELRRSVAYLAKMASALAWQAGVGGMETAGGFVSYLAANPERVENFITGGASDLPPSFHVEGCLSWHGMDGKIHHPRDIRKTGGRFEH